MIKDNKGWEYDLHERKTDRARPSSVEVICSLSEAFVNTTLADVVLLSMWTRLPLGRIKLDAYCPE